MYVPAFDVAVVASESDVLYHVTADFPDAVVSCCCTACAADVDDLTRLGALAWPVPLFACVRRFTPEFIRCAAVHGLHHLLFCELETDVIGDIITDTLRHRFIDELLETCWPGSLDVSPHVRRLIGEVMRAAPHAPTVHELAARLGVSRGWLHKLCKRAFGLPLTTFLRSLRVVQALHLLQRTDWDNADVAYHMQYTEESHMARDFRRILGCRPKEARVRLVHCSAVELLRSALIQVRTGAPGKAGIRG